MSLDGWIRSDTLPHLYKLDRKVQALSKKVNEVHAELRLAKVDQERLCSQLRTQNETIREVKDLVAKTKAEAEQACDADCEVAKKSGEGSDGSS